MLSISWRDLANNFLDWLPKDEAVAKVAHNGKKFDFPVLMLALENIGLSGAFSQ